MTRTLETGIEVLDRKLDGGLPAGRIVALSADPTSQSELFLYEMSKIRPTTYLTTERPAEEIEECLDRTGAPPDRVDVHRIGTSDPLGEATEIVGEMPDRSTLVIDPMWLLEGMEPDPYRRFLNEVKSRTVETGSLALLHCVEGRDVPGQRDRTEYLSDIIFDLRTTVRGGTIQNQLSIPKFRGGTALTDAIDLDLTADVTIDVTRKIA